MSEKKQPKPFAIDPVATRQKLGINQTKLWSRVGVTQSGGSRYESSRNIPRPVQMLLRIAYGTKAQADKQLSALRGQELAE